MREQKLAKDRNPHPPTRKLEKDRLRLLALVGLVMGAVTLGLLTHAEGLEVQGALADMRAAWEQAISGLGD